MDSLEQIINNSYKNFHARGVDYICLSRTPQLTRKLYIFQGDVATFPEVVHPHDHRYSFSTTVLRGALRNAVYAHAPYGQGTVFQHFNWRTPLNGGDGFEWGGEVALRIVALDTYFRGERHAMDHTGIHTIKVLENETALLQEQYADVQPVGEPTSTYTLDREPPSLSGLYERFTADEVIDRLSRFPGVL